MCTGAVPIFKTASSLTLLVYCRSSVYRAQLWNKLIKSDLSSLKGPERNAICRNNRNCCLKKFVACFTSGEIFSSIGHLVHLQLRCVNNWNTHVSVYIVIALNVFFLFWMKSSYQLLFLYKFYMHHLRLKHQYNWNIYIYISNLR